MFGSWAFDPGIMTLTLNSIYFLKLRFHGNAFVLQVIADSSVMDEMEILVRDEI